MQGYGFNVNVTVQDVTNLHWFGTNLDFNTSRISMQTYVFRNGFSGGCGDPSPPHEGLYCSGGLPLDEYITGSAVVLTITFRCEDAGSSQISVSSSPGWQEPGGSAWHDFAVTEGATVNQAAPVTVTLTATSNVTTTRIAVVTSWGYVTLSGTTTTTSVVTSVVSSVSTTGGPTVISTLTSTETATVTRSVTAGGTTTSTVTSVTTVASPMTVTETTTSVQSFEPPSPPSRCVIATAAYGSELAPDVAYMRYVRDELISSAPLGRTLVAVFNAFYYSWSPALAEWIAESALLMAIFRFLLLPLVGIIRVTALVFTATAGATGQTDAASLLAFLAVAIMTITIYVLLPIMAAAKSRQAIRGLRTRFRSQLRHLGHVG